MAACHCQSVFVRHREVRLMSYSSANRGNISKGRYLVLVSDSNTTGYTARPIGLKALSHYSQEMRILLILLAVAATSLQAATIDIASDMVGESNNQTGTNVYI